MFPIPSVPSETLHKFMALGGIIAIISILLLFSAEYQKISIDNVKLNTSIKLYNLKMTAYNKDIDEFNKKSTEDSLKFIQEYTKLFKEIKESIGNPKKTHKYIFNGKSYSADDYYYYVIRKRYHNSLDSLDVVSRARKKVSDSVDIDLIKINEQEMLININYDYLLYIRILTALIVSLGVICSLKGFREWSKLQRASDDMIYMQQEKLRKESASPVEKIILP